MTSATFEVLEPSLDRAIEIFGELGDDQGLARSWDFLGRMHVNAGRCAEALKAYAKAADHAAAAGDISMVMTETSQKAALAVYGPTPVEEALTLCEETLEFVKGYRANEAWVHQHRGRLEAMRGNLEAARGAISHARSVAHELGATHMLAVMSGGAAEIEWYAGDAGAEEREHRSGYEAFERSGADSFRATWAALLALSLVRLGRAGEEALELTRESESLASNDDITAQIPWREGRALILARRGKTDEAEKLAREAVDIAERTDWLNLQGDAYMALAEVLRVAGHTSEAVEAASEAVERYERKGNIVAAGWGHALLEELES
jgi:tetratricopeptide (TPR) repeat protein